MSCFNGVADFLLLTDPRELTEGRMPRVGFQDIVPMMSFDYFPHNFHAFVTNINQFSLPGESVKVATWREGVAYSGQPTECVHIEQRPVVAKKNCL